MEKFVVKTVKRPRIDKGTPTGVKSEVYEKLFTVFQVMFVRLSDSPKIVRRSFHLVI